VVELAHAGLFERLFDDAALFPPGDSPMAVAVPAHAVLQRQLAPLVGPFVVPAHRLGELIAELGEGAELAISLIAGPDELPAAVEQIVARPGLVLAAVEVPEVADPDQAAAACRAVTTAVRAGVGAAIEIPRTERRDEVLDALAGSGCRVKLRTGGLRRGLFPDPAELADTIGACVRRGIAFKCTAGLHSAVRHTDAETGFVHHGFLNILAATDAAVAGDPQAAAALLAEPDAGVLAGAVRGWSAEQVQRARRTFTSFGTCSVAEPVADLVALGLLPAGTGAVGI
jgi:hypothetical protein